MTKQKFHMTNSNILQAIIPILNHSSQISHFLHLSKELGLEGGIFPPDLMFGDVLIK